MPTDTTSPALTGRRLPLPEFTAMIALLFATVAFSIDSMLPALPEIAAELVPGDVNRAQLILTAFVFGMGVGTLFAGPISDAIGRKPTLIGGLTLYILGSILAMFADTIELLLVARVLQGLGAACPRIAALAVIRDLYAGREMARVTSFVMMIFILIPAVAPLIGQGIIAVTGWHGVFGAFVVLALVGGSWFSIRQVETLPAERRRPMTAGSLATAAREVLSSREVQLYTLVLTLGFGQMFAMISSAQQLFDVTFDRGDSFPLWFAVMAVLAGSASLMNASMVVRYGMRRIATTAYVTQSAVSAVMLVLVMGDLLPPGLLFPAYFVWMTSVFFMAGVTFGNLNALALQKMGHIAGMAASIVSAVSTVLATVIAAPIGLMFDGTGRPLVLGVFLCSAIAALLMRRSARFD
ncbi:multidrug effflux MFS transporter [Frigidibacter oleivorans]|uniref:multidrug effflux MFS transporter n=1 Tax=Frigidibacter oleivorans TaxID=2487129 RepID=UPI001F465E47|nr:multidrug effflux MFS transporter [Frigidibacter oleivorans]